MSIFTYTQYSEYIYEAKRNHIGILSYSPLSQGILSNSFVSRVGRWFTQSTNEKISTQSTRAEKYLHRHEAVNLYRKVLQLDLLAKARNQTLSQMAMAWLFQYQHICSVIMGVRNQTQLDENIFNRNPPGFTTDENCRIHQIVSELKL